MGVVVLGVVLVGAGGCSNGSRRYPVLDGSTGDGAAAQCGDNVVESGEQCDDGNLLSGDGCSPTCQLEQCDPTTCFTGCCDATGTCVGGVGDAACGTGGGSCVDCSAGSNLCYQQQCVQNDCTPGEILECGFCGQRTCQADGTYGDCSSVGECLPDTVDIVGPCEFCGQLVRTCDQTCHYGPEVCTGSGVCEATTVETGTECGTCGQNQRTCNSQCLWDSWQCVGEGTCPGTGGECCASTCTDTQTDPAHCGGCNAPCGIGEDCCSGDCANLQSDPAHCGGCGIPCGTNQQCCAGSCSPYTCITGGSIPWDSVNGDIWPAPLPCPAGSYTVGVITQRHWNHKRVYSICVDGAQAGSIPACSGEPGVCTPPLCPSGSASVGIFVDRSPALVTEQQRICVGLASGGSLNSCDIVIGDPACTPAACATGDADIGILHEIDPVAGTTSYIRVCVTPSCPPPCP